MLVICLSCSLCACGKSAGGKNVVEVVGTWTAHNGSSRVYISLNEDYTGEMEAEGIAFKFTWEYDKSTHDVTIDFEAVSLPGKLTYNPQDDTLIFLDGTILSRVNSK